MQWFLFFIVVMLCCSCGSNAVHKPPMNVDSSHRNEIADEYAGTIDNYKDSGCFTIASIQNRAGLSGSDGSMLANFLFRNCSREGIQLLSNQTLEHHIRLDHQKLYRYDTLRNNTTTILLISHFDAHESQRMVIDGHEVSNYQWNGIDSMREVMIDLDAASFTHFNFYGNEFYYFEGREMNRSGGPASLVSYKYLYDLRQKMLSSFFNFRVFNATLFGDFNNDHRLDFFDVQNEGGYTIDSLNHFTATIYTHQPTGKFDILRDQKGTAYYLDGNTGDDYYVGDSMNITDSYWPVPLK